MRLFKFALSRFYYCPSIVCVFVFIIVHCAHRYNTLTYIIIIHSQMSIHEHVWTLSACALSCHTLTSSNSIGGFLFRLLVCVCLSLFFHIGWPNFCVIPLILVNFMVSFLHSIQNGLRSVLAINANFASGLFTISINRLYICFVITLFFSFTNLNF